MGSLFRDRDFRLLFVGQGISEVGTALTIAHLVAVSLLAGALSVLGNFVFGGYAAIVVVFLYETLGLREAPCSPRRSAAPSATPG